MAFESLGWFQGRKKEREEAQRLLLEEIQGLKKHLRKQSALIEEVRREQEAIAAKQPEEAGRLIDLCDAVFYLQRAFQSPGLMSRQHAQVVSMVIKRMDRFAALLDLQTVMEEGVPFDPDIHEAIANRSPGASALEVMEVVQPGYVQKSRVLRPAKVIVGSASESES